MSNTQYIEFRNRVDTIENGGRKPRRPLKRNYFGTVVERTSPTLSARFVKTLRRFVILYICFAVIKAILIHDMGASDYNKRIATLNAGDVKSQVLGTVMAPAPYSMVLGNAVVTVREYGIQAYDMVAKELAE